MALDEAQAAAITGPLAVDGIGPTADLQGYRERSEADKRQGASWIA